MIDPVEKTITKASWRQGKIEGKTKVTNLVDDSVGQI